MCGEVALLLLCGVQSSSENLVDFNFSTEIIR